MRPDSRCIPPPRQAHYGHGLRGKDVYRQRPNEIQRNLRPGASRDAGVRWRYAPAHDWEAS